MIPTLIYLLLRKYRKTHPDAAIKLQKTIGRIGRIIVLLIVFIAAAHLVVAQERKLDYVIKRKGNEVGTLSFTQYAAGNKTRLKMESVVRTRFILLFTAKAKEESIYENGVLTWSSIYRKMNGNEKANKRTTLAGTGYVIRKGEKTETLSNYPIRYNMLSLYVQEPVNNWKVYSDNFQEFLNIETVAAHHYKIRFPDGNSSEYFYRNGICVKVKLNHSLYSASIELKP